MKKLLLLLTLLVGCSPGQVVDEKHLFFAELICRDRGGFASIGVTGDDHVNCKDEEKIYITIETVHDAIRKNYGDHMVCPPSLENDSQ